MLELVLGGARSGKSGYAQDCAIDNKQPILLIATATADDEEMQQRIKLHQQTRPSDIAVIEEPLQLSNTLQAHCNTEKTIIVDCLTLWLSNLLLQDETDLENSFEYKALINNLELLSQAKANIYLVSNEVGMGIIPLGKLNRIYCDAVGHLHQAIAKHAQRVTLMVAGLAHSIKNESMC